MESLCGRKAPSVAQEVKTHPDSRQCCMVTASIFVHLCMSRTVNTVKTSYYILKVRDCSVKRADTPPVKGPGTFQKAPL